METNITQQMNKLIEYKPSIDQILLCSPYEFESSIDGLMTQELFQEKLFFNYPTLDSLKDELKRQITSTVFTHTIILITGYNGIGKSTFLRYFQYENRNFEHRTIDFYNPKVGVPIINNSQPKGDPISIILQQYIINDFDNVDLMRCLRLIKEHSLKMREIFSIKFMQFADSLEEIDETSIIRYFDSVDDKQDTLLLYLLLLFLTSMKKEKCIVYFDNMDAVGIDYLSNSFQSIFRSTFASAMKLSTLNIFPDPVYFQKRYRFVFCVRDSSTSVFNVHNDHKMSPYIEYLPYRLRMGSEYYKGIIEKRLDLISEVLGRNPDRDVIRDVMKEFIGDKRFFEPALVNAFNCDYRKLALSLLIMANRLGKIKEFLLSYQRYSGFGKMGTLLRCVVDFLREKAFLLDEVEAEYDPEKYQGGTLHQKRMILNLILNYSRGHIEEQSDDPDRLRSDCTLPQIINDFKGIYLPSDVLNVLAECYLYHEKNWVQLVSIYNDFITQNNKFEEEKRLFEELERINSKLDSESGETVLNRRAEILDQLNRILIKITPAGISYIKYINTHFEFYSSFIRLDTPPLFLVNPRTTSIPRTQYDLTTYLFEEIIDSVIKRVSNHLLMLKRFYLNVFESKKHYTDKMFRFSRYSFKYFGVTPRAYGMFHSTRVICSHIDYIDHYRLYILSGGFNLNENESKDINRRLIERIERYNNFLKNSYDGNAQSFHDAFLKQIRKIKQSEYSNTKTPIEIEVYREEFEPNELVGT